MFSITFHCSFFSFGIEKCNLNSLNLFHYSVKKRRKFVTSYEIDFMVWYFFKIKDLIRFWNEQDFIFSRENGNELQKLFHFESWRISVFVFRIKCGLVFEQWCLHKFGFNFEYKINHPIVNRSIVINSLFHFLFYEHS